MASDEVKLERALITDLVFGCLSLLIAFPNMIQTYLNMTKKKREGCGLLQKWYHNTLWFGGVVSFTASILLNVSTGGIVAAVSITLNDVLAWLFTITLSYTTFVELQVSYHTVTMTEFPKWPEYILYLFNGITIIMWLIGVLIMSSYSNRSIFKAPAFFLNAFCLFGLTVTIAVASWKLIKLNDEVEKSLTDCEHLKRAKESGSEKKMAAFKKFTGSVIFVALAVMSWILYSASRVVNGTSQYVTQQKSYNSVASAVAARFLCFLVMAVFTYRMWLWEGFPMLLCCKKFIPAAAAGGDSRIGSSSQSSAKKSPRTSTRSSGPVNRRASGTTTTSNVGSSVVAEPSQIHRSSVMTPTHDEIASIELETKTTSDPVTLPSSSIPTQVLPGATEPSTASSSSSSQQQQPIDQTDHQTTNNQGEFISRPSSSIVEENLQVSISLDLSGGKTVYQGSPLTDPEEPSAAVIGSSYTSDAELPTTNS